jgi:multidrug efflux pump subunit AcrB
VIKQAGDSIVRLEDVAEVTLGAENYDLNVAFSGKRSVFIGIKVAPRANILSVAKRVRERVSRSAVAAADRASPARSSTTRPSSSTRRSPRSSRRCWNRSSS